MILVGESDRAALIGIAAIVHSLSRDCLALNVIGSFQNPLMSFKV